MASINKVILLGRLGKDPETRFDNSNQQITNITIATDRMIRQPGGGFAKDTDWTRVVSFGRTAENIQKYLKKGSSCCVEGRLQTRKYTDRDGTDRIITEVVANTVQFMDSKPEAKPQSYSQKSQSQGSVQRRQSQQERGDWNDQGGFDDNNNEDLPF